MKVPQLKPLEYSKIEVIEKLNLKFEENQMYLKSFRKVYVKN
jgi:hypothetical protein